MTGKPKKIISIILQNHQNDFSFYQNDFLPSFSFWLFLYEVIFSSDTKTLCHRLKTNMTGSGTNVTSKQKLQSAIY